LNVNLPIEEGIIIDQRYNTLKNSFTIPSLETEFSDMVRSEAEPAKARCTTSQRIYGYNTIVSGVQTQLHL